jgi:hypothetical protein
MAEQQSDWGLKWELLVADAWDDPALKQRLLSNPETVLKERGITPPAGKKFKVEEETDVIYLVLPPKPAEEELSEEQLESVAGGHCGPCGCRPPCGPCGCRPPCGPCGRGCRPPCGPPCGRPPCGGCHS